jgi:small subunit ribosomal protein S17
MSDDETKKDETTEETPVSEEPQADESAEQAPAAEEAPAEETPAEEPVAEAEPDETPAAEEVPAPAAEAAPAEPNPEDDLPWKERRRLQRSRRPHEPRPALSPEERAAQRREHRKAKAAERRKERAADKGAKSGTGVGTPEAQRESNAAKVRQGIVVSNKGDKSITVRIDIARRHPTYEKIVRRSRTLHAHDERNEAGEGDVVRVVETRPLSKTKRWRLVDVVEKAR